MYDIEQLRREEFPLSAKHLYFNHAGISPLPERTKKKMQWAIQRLAEDPTGHFMQEGMTMFGNFSKELAVLINAAEVREIAPVTTTSVALNQIAAAIHWQSGDKVLFCEVEFPSNAFPWLSLVKQGVEVRQVPAIQGGLTVEGLESLVDKKTRLIAVSALQFFTGHRTDLQAIGDFCHERDIIFVVDAIQAIGHMKIDVQAMHIDVLASGGQKSILGPPGIGFLYVRDNLCEQLQPPFPGPNSTQDYRHWLKYDLTPLAGAARFGAGTPNVAGMFGLLESVTLLKELGIDNIDRHTQAIADSCITMLTEMGYNVITRRESHGSIVTFASGLENTETDKLVAYLISKNVSMVKHLDVSGVPHLRMSFHCYNKKEELERFKVIMEEFRKN